MKDYECVISEQTVHDIQVLYDRSEQLATQSQVLGQESQIQKSQLNSLITKSNLVCQPSDISQNAV